MRSSRLLLIPTLILPILMAVGAQAQAPVSPQYVVLYAHSYGNQQILNALPQWTGEKTADLSKGVTFRLSPVLGGNLEIEGAITFTLYLRASGAFFGAVGVQVTELSKEGTETNVAGQRIDTLSLTTTVTPVTLGVGIIDYQFRGGSTIVLRINANQTSGTGPALLVWDDGRTPTGLRIQVTSPTSVDFHFVGQPRFGNIFQADSTGCQVVTIQVEVRDTIGVYRLSSPTFELTAPNGSNIDLALNAGNNTDYSSLLSVTSRLCQGEWQVALSLRDLSGGSYSFTDHLWVSPFVPFSFRLIGSNGIPLPNTTVRVNFEGASWNVTTDMTGIGSVSLPSIVSFSMLPLPEIVGPKNSTIIWLTEIRPPVGPINVTLYSLAVRVVLKTPLFELPIPGATVTILQKGPVQKAVTGMDGVANFKANFPDIYGEDYSVQVDYLFATYQTPLSVNTITSSLNGEATVEVPFPHPTITILTALTVLCLAAVALVRKRRELHPNAIKRIANNLTSFLGGLWCTQAI